MWKTTTTEEEEEEEKEEEEEEEEEEEVGSVFRNALLSHHNYFSKATKMSSVVFKCVSPVNNLEILSLCLYNRKNTLKTTRVNLD
ncbi:hypothetical protein E2C01_086177 [Portunus trituberculatus]|uniref:Uncharacterized protein n=1 Tax=Portunus trituberculatus TaxID=210409 RepID=A0A5B7JDW6_PORTR|nr:hypothetical protein [Portunus trituberculatus]